jgi:hypothetical protein
MELSNQTTQKNLILLALRLSLVTQLIKFGVNESMILTLFLSSNAHSILGLIMLFIALLE